jgi:hypothetical protein
MSKTLQPQYASQKGVIADTLVRNVMALGEGTAVPADGLPGYGEGCLFLLRFGIAGANLFVNNGTRTACLFRPFDSALTRQLFGVAGGVAPGTLAADIVFGVFSIPAGFFGQTGRGVNIIASGTFAVSATNKRARLWFNPTTAVLQSAVTGGIILGDTGVVATSGGSWYLEGDVFKTGLPGSNTQTTVSIQQTAGGVSLGTSPNFDTTAVENAPILVAVTLNNTTVLTDSLLGLFEIDSSN